MNVIVTIRGIDVTLNMIEALQLFKQLKKGLGK